MYLFKNNTHQNKINTWGDYHIRKEWGIYIKYKALWSLLFHPSDSPPVGLITNSVIQRYE